MHRGRNLHSSSASGKYSKTATTYPRCNWGNLIAVDSALLVTASFSGALTDHLHKEQPVARATVKLLSVDLGKTCKHLILHLATCRCGISLNALPKIMSAGNQCHWELNPTFPTVRSLFLLDHSTAVLQY